MKKKKYYLVPAALIVMISCFVFCTFARNSAEETAITQDAIASAAELSAVSKDKILIAYFTSPETDGTDAVSGASRVIVDGQLYGNTEYVAKVIQQETGGTLFEIKTVKPYPGSHKALVDYGKMENETKARPQLATKIENLDQYDVVFIGFPNWWYDMPMPMYTFFEQYDFRGKTIIPFNTHGGSRFSDAIKTITNLEKGAKVLRGLPISRDNVSKSKANIVKWLKDLGMI